MPTRTTRLIALGFAGLGVGAALAGCATTPGAGTGGGSDTGTDPGADTSAEYADGDYEALGEYVSPAGPSEVTVALTLEDDIVTAVTVTPHATNPNSLQFQTQFADGIAAAIVGQDIDTLSVSRIGGSSLTSGGFNDALAQIKAEAVS